MTMSVVPSDVPGWYIQPISQNLNSLWPLLGTFATHERCKLKVDKGGGNSTSGQGAAEEVTIGVDYRYL